MSANGNQILILGLGNDILGDDGIGSRLANDLKGELGEGLYSFRSSVLGGIELIDLMEGYPLAVIIDGIRTRDGQPGDVYLMDDQEHLETLHISSFHDLKFDTALEYASQVGIEMPLSIQIIAVEIEEDTLFSESLTQALDNKYPSIYQLVKTHIQSLSRNWQQRA